MNFVVLLKQVPDISNVPPEAWDSTKGILKRGVLDSAVNPLDLHALTFACQMREADRGSGSRIICLTMGPASAAEVLFDALSRGADEAVLLTDPSFAGADTAATSYALAQAIRKIEAELLNGDRDYVIVSGVQSVDGDTAQVPAQVAEALGIDLVCYVVGFECHPERRYHRIGPAGMETVSARRHPIVLTLTDCTEPLYPSFERARAARSRPQAWRTWHAEDIEAKPDAIGLTGSRTRVVRIFSPSEAGRKQCIFVETAEALIDRVGERLKNASTLEQPQARPTAAPVPRKDYTGEVWVYAETRGGTLAPVALELLGKGRDLADRLGEKLAAVLLGHNVGHHAPELIRFGADRVYVVDDPALAQFRSLPYKSALAQLVQQERPQILLFGATPLGRELAPRVAYATQSGLTADCTGLEIGDYQHSAGILLQTRPALGGNIMATIITNSSRTQMATARPGVFKAVAPDPARPGQIVDCRVEPDKGDVTILSVEAVEKTAGLASAEIVVSGGAGLRSSDNYERLVRPLAEALGKRFGLRTEVGASRRAVETGLIGRDHQVGQTGQTVQPSLYFAIGISGAVQHITGMQKSRLVVAINPDPKAPIFRVADFGIVGKAEAVVPRLIELLREDRHG